MEVNKIKFWSYKSDCVNKELANDSFESLAKLLEEYHEPIIEMKSNVQPLFGFFSEPKDLIYKYFGRVAKGQSFTKELYLLRDIASHLTSIDSEKFNAAFVNLYRNGSDSVTPHRDKTHSKNPIVSFSFYENRNQISRQDLRSLFIQKHEVDKSPEEELHFIEMEHGSVIIMYPGMQEKYVHWVPPNESTQRRINVTFRIQ